MTVVAEWSGRHATTLRRALRLTNERFAEELGTAVRTVAKWSAEPTIVPTPEIQRALDTMLSRSPDDVHVRFSMLLADDEPTPATDAHEDVLAATRRLDTDRDIQHALDWIDRVSGRPSGTAHRAIVTAMSTDRVHSVRAKRALHASVTRAQIADAIGSYYGTDSAHSTYRARTASGSLATSILTRSTWLDLGQPIGPGTDDLRLAGDTPYEPTDVDENAAIDRLTTVVLSGTRLVNSNLYRLTQLDLDGSRLTGSLAVTDFVPYALTMDLLEAELVDALAVCDGARPGRLPLRDRYLPNLTSVVDVGARLCVGGTLALTAIARPRSRRHDADYVLLVQERSSLVLNANGRLAVIPKAFHGPLADIADDAPIGASLVRELEEELFGRTDVDSTITDPRHADPLHLSRLSEPMAWLTEHDDSWQMECTGVGFNLVNGNYEFADLVLIEDEEWWALFGGHIEANWESGALRRYSSRDRDVLDTLAHSPGWSNEGLFALLQGFRRLAVLGGSRVDLPVVELEL